MGPLLMGGIGLGLSVLGRIGQGATRNTYFQDQIKSQLDNFRRDRYVPDYAPFQQNIQLMIDDALSQIPASTEAINADFARRGLYSGSEAPAAVVKHAIDPIVRSALMAGVQGEMGYQQLAMQGRSAADQYYMQLIRAGQADQASQQPTTANDLFGLVAGGGDFAMQYGVLRKMGFFGDSPTAAAGRPRYV